VVFFIADNNNFKKLLIKGVIEMVKKILSMVICLCLVFEQSGFAQVTPQINLPIFNSFSSLEKSRPMHLRSLSYDYLSNNFNLLIDKGDTKKPEFPLIKDTTQKLLEYFQVGLTLSNSSFWVNLRPDEAKDIIDPDLARTDVGKILLEADLQLKKDTAAFTSPNTQEGRQYWNKLYEKAGELFGNEAVSIPTLTRPWIVPGEILVSQTRGENSAYIYKATLKVMLEKDYLKSSTAYSFNDPRLKELNEYSSELMRKHIIPKLNKEVNSAKKYASLRQVYYSLILAQWFKQQFRNGPGKFAALIDRKDLSNLTSKEPWSKDTYFDQYKKSFKDGEYKIQEAQYSNFGRSIRSYFSGGINLDKMVVAPRADGGVASIFRGGLPVSGPNIMGLTVDARNLEILRMEEGTTPVKFRSTPATDGGIIEDKINSIFAATEEGMAGIRAMQRIDEAYRVDKEYPSIIKESTVKQLVALGQSALPVLENLNNSIEKRRKVCIEEAINILKQSSKQYGGDIPEQALLEKLSAIKSKAENRADLQAISVKEKEKVDLRITDVESLVIIFSPDTRKEKRIYLLKEEGKYYILTDRGKIEELKIGKAIDKNYPIQLLSPYTLDWDIYIKTLFNKNVFLNVAPSECMIHILNVDSNNVSILDKKTEKWVPYTVAKQDGGTVKVQSEENIMRADRLEKEIDNLIQNKAYEAAQDLTQELLRLDRYRGLEKQLNVAKARGDMEAASKISDEMLSEPLPVDRMPDMDFSSRGPNIAKDGGVGTLRAALDREWLLANHLFMAFHVAFISSLLSLPAGETFNFIQVLQFVFASLETPISAMFLYTTWHTAISLHEMGHYLKAVKTSALKPELLKDAQEKMNQPFLKRLVWYIKMFIKIPLGKFEGVVKSAPETEAKGTVAKIGGRIRNFFVASFHPDAPFNLAVAAEGPAFSFKVSRIALPVAITLITLGLIGKGMTGDIVQLAEVMLYAGRAVLGIGIVTLLDRFFADPGKYKEFQERERKAAEKAKEIQAKMTGEVKAWKERMPEVMAWMLSHRIQEGTLNGLPIRAPYGWRNSLMGGRHTEKEYPKSNISFQEGMFIPLTAKTYEEAQQITVELQTRLMQIIEKAEGATVMGIGLEGGLATYIQKEKGDKVPEQRLWRFAKQAIIDIGKEPGVDVVLAIDPANSELEIAYREKFEQPEAKGMYLFWRDEDQTVMSRDELVDLIVGAIEEGIPIISVEDHFAEDDYEGWRNWMAKYGHMMFVIADDIATTKDSTVEMIGDEGLANALLVKANQIGTLSETEIAMLTARGKNMWLVVSHRSKSPNDDMEAQVAIAADAEGIKAGGGANTERLIKYGAIIKMMKEAIRQKAQGPQMADKALEDLAWQLIPQLRITRIIAYEEATNAGIPTVGVKVSVGVPGSKAFENLMEFTGSTPLGTSAGTGEAIHLVDSIIQTGELTQKYADLFTLQPDKTYKFKKDVNDAVIQSKNDTTLSALFIQAQRYGGKGTQNAVANVEQILSKLFVGKKASEIDSIFKIDQILLNAELELGIQRGKISKDASKAEKIAFMQRKGELGMNAILSMSLALGRMAAAVQGKELWQLMREEMGQTIAAVIAPSEGKSKEEILKGNTYAQLVEKLKAFEEQRKAQGDQKKLYEYLREGLPVYGAASATADGGRNIDGDFKKGDEYRTMPGTQLFQEPSQDPMFGMRGIKLMQQNLPSADNTKMADGGLIQRQGNEKISIPWFGIDINIPQELVSDLGMAWKIVSALDDAEKIFADAVQGRQDIRGGKVERVDSAFVEANTDGLLEAVKDETAAKLEALSDQYGIEAVTKVFELLESQLPVGSASHKCIQTALKNIKENSATEMQQDGGKQTEAERARKLAKGIETYLKKEFTKYVAYFEKTNPDKSREQIIGSILKSQYYMFTFYEEVNSGLAIDHHIIMTRQEDNTGWRMYTDNKDIILAGFFLKGTKSEINVFVSQVGSSAKEASNPVGNQGDTVQDRDGGNIVIDRGTPVEDLNQLRQRKIASPSSADKELLEMLDYQAMPYEERRAIRTDEDAVRILMTRTFVNLLKEGTAQITSTEQWEQLNKGDVLLLFRQSNKRLVLQQMAVFIGLKGKGSDVRLAYEGIDKKFGYSLNIGVPVSEFVGSADEVRVIPVIQPMKMDLPVPVASDFAELTGDFSNTPIRGITDNYRDASSREQVTDGGSKMPTGERYSAIDTSGQVKREDNDKDSGQAAESSSKSSGQINTGDNTVFDGGSELVKDGGKSQDLINAIRLLEKSIPIIEAEVERNIVELEREKQAAPLEEQQQYQKRIDKARDHLEQAKINLKKLKGSEDIAQATDGGITVVKLKNGAEEAEPLVKVVMLSLSSLFEADRMDYAFAFYELVMKARDPKHEIFSNVHKNVLKDLALVQSNGRMHDSIRNIVLSAVEGEGLAMKLVSPFAAQEKQGGIAAGDAKQDGGQNQNPVGGIDFRALPIVNQPIGNYLQSIFGQNPGINISNLDVEWESIYRLVQMNVSPSSQRIKEFLWGCCQKGELDQRATDVLACIGEILRLEENEAKDTEPDIKNMLVLLEANR
jgi:enolase